MLSRRPKGATMHDQGKNSIASLLWMLFGAIVTLGVGVFMYKSGVFDLGASNQQQDSQKQIETKINLDKDNTDYQYHDVLQNQDSKTIPDTVVPDQPTDKDIKNQAERLEPDVVVIGTQEELDVADPSKSNSIKPFNPAVSNDGNNEIVIEYENGTYGDDKSSKTLGNSELTKSEEADKPQDVIKTLPINENQAIKTVINEKSGKNTTETDNITKTITNKDSNDSNRGRNPVAILQTASDTDKASKPNKNSEPNKSYILQINSFDSADEADKRRAQVLMAGIDDAYVVKKNINDQTVYQVVSNSMSSKESVIQNQQRLKNSGIDSLVIEQRVK